MSFCQIDLELYGEALDSLSQAQGINNEYLRELVMQLQITQSNEPPAVTPPHSSQDDEYLYTMRIAWILLYHQCLCYYMTKRYQLAEDAITECTSDKYEKFIPDELSLGTLFFFLAQCQMALSKFDEALFNFSKCESRAHWKALKSNEFLLLFALAKCHQSRGHHEQALELFNSALANVTCSEASKPYVYFRRAWSFKALNDFIHAGDDFEMAKFYSPNDPNFAIDYKRISKCEYMVISTEPDLIEPFPPLLPVPGMHSY